MAAQQDFSTFHQLVSNLFRWPSTPEEWDQYRLNGDQLAFYKEFGYIGNIGATS